MPDHERLRDHNDPDLDTIASLQRSITATLTYLMGRASVAELFGTLAYLSKLASQMAPVNRYAALPQEMPAALNQQLAEMERQRQRQGQQPQTFAQYRQET